MDTSDTTDSTRTTDIGGTTAATEAETTAATGETGRPTRNSHAGRTDPNGRTTPNNPTPLYDDEWRALPERMRRVWMTNEVIGAVITWAVCGAVAAVCISNGWWGFWQRVIVGLVALYALLDLAFQPLQTRYAYAFHRFRIGARDLRVGRGWLFRRTTTVPYNRVQHVDTRQNPVLRHFGLTAVVVHTAADELEIDALDTAEAERVVSLIADRVASAKEDL